jgi:signal transduction histidine kinase
LPFAVGFVVFSLIMGIYVSELLARYEVDSGNWILLYSIGAGMLLCLLKVAALSLRVTRPLDKMKTAALGISGGDYTAKTGVKQSDEIGELAAILDDMARELGKASDEKAETEKRRRDFMATVSHELRTPITVIRGSLEALRDGVVTDPVLVAEYYCQMHAESLHLERLVSDLLDLARLQSHEFYMDMDKVDIKDIAQDAVRGMKSVAEQKGVRLEFLPGDNVPFPTLGDYGRLKQLLVALLDNAIKFTPAGKKVEMHLLNKEDRVCVRIYDEGSGISDGDLPHIFERFYKSHEAENKTGTGLGLPIAKQIAERHGADIHVACTSGQGTMVEVLF